MVDTGRAEAYARAERALALPMLVLALLLIPVLVIPVVWSAMPPDVRTALNAADYAIWAGFAVEYLLLLGLASDRKRYLRTHLLELALVALPMLRPIRVLRTARLLRALRVTRAVVGAGTALSLSRRRLVVSAGLYAPAAAGVLALAASVLVLDAERGAKDANITSLPDALWWAMTTVTTVGYGDRYPVTAEGRAIAVCLMIVGIALLGVITASVAAAFVRWSSLPVEVEEVQEHADQSADLAALLAEVRALRAEVLTLRAHPVHLPVPPQRSTKGRPAPRGRGRMR